MTIYEIIIAVLAVVAIIVSIYTHFETKGSKFEGYAFSVSKIALSWFCRTDTSKSPPFEIWTPCIISQCEYINLGAKIGKIDSVMLEVSDNHSGSVTRFEVAYASKEPTDFILEQQQELEEDLTHFSTTWLGGHAFKQNYLYFVPKTSFSIDASSDFKVKLLYFSVDNFALVRRWYNNVFSWIRKIFRSSDDNSLEIIWKTSPVWYNFKLSEANSSDWLHHNLVMLEAIEVEKGKNYYFSNH